MHRSILIAIVVYIGSFFLPAFVCAEDSALPNPLSLPQALAYAEKHPRNKLDSKTNRYYPPFETLYLDCHALAYANKTNILNESRRDRLFSPLFSIKESVKIDILRRFFDVLLADMSFAFSNENMAGAFITLDRAKNRQELNSASELEVAAKDAAYQLIRQQRFASESTQRLTRSLLAQAIGQPEKLPSDLKLINKLPVIPKELPNLTSLYAAALKNNAALIERLEALSDEEQDILKMELRQYLLERLLQIQQLDIVNQKSQAESYWRDLKLDQSRTLYDMEVKSDLGDSMAQQTKAQLQEKQIEYCKALAWSELNILQGKALLAGTSEVIKEEEKKQ